jgi:Kef-type K+ transport system membrane component KefB
MRRSSAWGWCHCEVGIIVAGIGNATGTIDAKLFAIIVAMSVLTTLLVPPVLRRLASEEPDVAGRAAAA